MPMPRKPRGNCRHCQQALHLPGRQFCTNRCQTDYKQRVYIERWQAGLESGIRGAGVSQHIRRYLIAKYGEQCVRCGWAERHPVTGKVPLETEHIDGNWQNTAEDNLILLCPNCHSLTTTYRNLNKGKGRAFRRAGIA